MALRAFDASDTFGNALSAALGATKEKYPEIWGDSASLAWLVAAFISIGTEAIVLKNKYYCETAASFSEYLMQYLTCRIYKSQPMAYMARVKDLLAADERRLVSYLKKRIPCSCLDGAYERVKSLPKRSAIWGTIPRVL